MEVEMNRARHAVDYENEWLGLLHKLIAKAGEGEIYVLYTFPDGRLATTGFLPSVNERWLVILLQPQAPSGLAGGVLRLHLPPEDTAQYWQYEDENGDMYLSVGYSYLNLPLEDDQVAHIELATKPELLDPEVNAPLVQ
jgi:hypothetical protein